MQNVGRACSSAFFPCISAHGPAAAQLVSPAQHQLGSSANGSPAEMSRTGSESSVNGGIGRLRKDTM